MFGRRRLERLEAGQRAVLEQVGHITTALIAREPGTALSVNAYDGLRKQVSIAARDRRQHLARLVEMMEVIDRGATVETLRRKCEQWCHEVGLEAVSDPRGAAAQWFRIVEGDGPELEVLTPAWADTEAGHLVQRGAARRVWPTPVDGSDGSDDEEAVEPEQTGEPEPTAEVEQTVEPAEATEVGGWSETDDGAGAPAAAAGDTGEPAGGAEDAQHEDNQHEDNQHEDNQETESAT